MPSITQENYLKQVYLLSQDASTVPMGKLAQRMEVVPGTATTMVKAMEKEGWIRYIPRKGVEITADGTHQALKILRKHRIVEMFLVEVLKLDWSEVHEEAEALEHAMSDKLVEHIDDFLGHPSFDPHGDPIPSKSGALTPQILRPLSQCQPGDKVKVARIRDQDEKFLRYLDRSRLTPGSELEIISHETIAKMLEYQLKGDHQSRSLSANTAEQILVTAALH